MGKEVGMIDMFLNMFLQDEMPLRLAVTALLVLAIVVLFQIVRHDPANRRQSFWVAVCMFTGLLVAVAGIVMVGWATALPAKQLAVLIVLLGGGAIVLSLLMLIALAIDTK